MYVSIQLTFSWCIWTIFETEIRCLNATLIWLLKSKLHEIVSMQRKTCEWTVSRGAEELLCQISHELKGYSSAHCFSSLLLWSKATKYSAYLSNLGRGTSQTSKLLNFCFIFRLPTIRNSSHRELLSSAVIVMKTYSSYKTTFWFF